MQDIEFTIEDGTLYILQTRTGKRTARAAGAHRRGDGRQAPPHHAAPRPWGASSPTSSIACCIRSSIRRPNAYRHRDGPARQSRARSAGEVVFTADDAKERAATRGAAVILVRNETSPEDVGGMHAAEGILTATGGMTSHAAVVARGMGKCCVSGRG